MFRATNSPILRSIFWLYIQLLLRLRWNWNSSISTVAPVCSSVGAFYQKLYILVQSKSAPEDGRICRPKHVGIKKISKRKSCCILLVICTVVFIKILPDFLSFKKTLHLCNPKFQDCVHTSTTFNLVLSHINLAHTFLSYKFKIHFNIIFPTKTRFIK